jgi:hypothetical protein
LLAGRSRVRERLSVVRTEQNPLLRISVGSHGFFVGRFARETPEGFVFNPRSLAFNRG